MSIEAVQHEISTWDDAKLRHLIAYAVVLQDRKNGSFPGGFATRPDSPECWVSLEELDQKLGFTPEELAE